MDNYIVLNGKRFDFTEEMITTLAGINTSSEAEANKDPFARADKNDRYYYITEYSDLDYLHENYENANQAMFDIANYCADEALMKQRALHETLNRLLWRYSEQHGGEGEWDGENYHWTIGYDIEDKQFEWTWAINYREFSCVYFSKLEIAQAATEEIVQPFLKEHPEFVW